METIPKKTYMTAEQREVLLGLMARQPELRSGKFTKEFTCKRAHLMWKVIAKKLNAMEGATKDWKQWRKAWLDSKRNIKSRQATKAVSASTNGCKSSMGSKLDPVEPIPNDTEPKASFEILDVSTITEQPESEVFNTASSTNGTNTKNTPPSWTSKFKRRKIILAPNKLEGAMSKDAELKIKSMALKSEYYKKKISLMEEDVLAKERIAMALGSIADALGVLAENTKVF